MNYTTLKNYGDTVSIDWQTLDDGTVLVTMVNRNSNNSAVTQLSGVNVDKLKEFVASIGK